MSDIIINGETYEGVESITVNKTDGEQETFVLPNAAGTTVTTTDEEGNIVALKTFDADTKLDKVPDSHEAGIYFQVYGTKRGTGQVMYNVQAGDAVFGAAWIPTYKYPTSGGKDDAKYALLTTTPQQPYQCANKKYVDETVESNKRYLHKYVIEKYADETSGNGYALNIGIITNRATSYSTFRELLKTFELNASEGILEYYTSIANSVSEVYTILENHFPIQQYTNYSIEFYVYYADQDNPDDNDIIADVYINGHVQNMSINLNQSIMAEDIIEL